MLVQILCDQDALYYYANEAAIEMVKVWEQLGSSPLNTHHFKSVDRENYNQGNKAKVKMYKYMRKVKANQLFSYKRIPQKFFVFCKELL